MSSGTDNSESSCTETGGFALVTEAGSDASYTSRGLRTSKLFGLDFVNNLDEGEFVDWLLDGQPRNQQEMMVVTPNVDILVHARLDPELTSSMLENAGVVVADGWPIVAVSKLLPDSAVHRVTGSGVFCEIWPRLIKQERRVLAVAANEKVSKGLLEEYPAACVVVAPVIDASDPTSVEEFVKVVQRDVRLTEPEFVVLGVGHPRDVVLAEMIRKTWPDEVAPAHLLCFGGAAEMYLGLRRRAPRWMQTCGLEWLFRFGQEPVRLFSRYFVRDLVFIPMAAAEIFRRRSDGR